jgi:hypothetical protein
MILKREFPKYKSLEKKEANCGWLVMISLNFHIYDLLLGHYLGPLAQYVLSIGVNACRVEKSSSNVVLH